MGDPYLGIVGLNTVPEKLGSIIDVVNLYTLDNIQIVTRKFNLYHKHSSVKWKSSA
jgi:hypothetical protein